MDSETENSGIDLDMDSNPLRLNYSLVHELLVDFIASEIHRAGLEKAVVGLSGGIDSALVLHLTVDALGPGNVLAIMMPHSSSNPDSRADAEQVIKDTGCRSKLVDISPMVDPYIKKYTGDDNLRRGNVFARMRMIVLYDHSSEEKALVVGTSNKTELLLGYSTLFGDSAYAIGPIGDLYKTQVRELSAHIGVADQVISKPPSADLWMGQTDEEELGITYADADRILIQLVDNRVPPETLVERGEDEDTVMGILRKIRATQFKRTPPPIPKISSRSFGHDWLYARDWMT